MKRIQDYIYAFNTVRNFLFPDTEDVHVVVGVLKAFFRELPEPFFTNEARSDFRNAGDIFEDDKRIRQLRNVVSTLPACHRETMKVLVTFLKKVSDFSEENKMTPSNLTISLCPELGSVFTTMIENPDAVFANLKVDQHLQKKKSHS